MESRGGRARALAAILIAVMVFALARALAWPTANVQCASQAGIKEDGQVRVVCLEQARARLAQNPQLAAQVDNGSLVYARNSWWLGHLPLGARRILGMPVDINRLGSSDFEEISGIGPQLARQIIAARARRNGFQSVDDLLEVRGIGPKRVAKLREALTPDGP